MDSLNNHTYHTINKIRALQSLILKSLTFWLGPTLWGCVFEPTRAYRAGSGTICNGPRKIASHICATPQNDMSQLRVTVVVNKAQFNPVNTRCGIHHTPIHITHSLKLGHYNLPHIYPSRPRYGLLCGVVSPRPHGVTGPALIPNVTTLKIVLATST